MTYYPRQKSGFLGLPKAAEEGAPQRISCSQLQSGSFRCMRSKLCTPLSYYRYDESLVLHFDVRNSEKELSCTLSGRPKSLYEGLHELE